MLASLLAHAPEQFTDGAPRLATLSRARRLDEADLGTDSLGCLQLAERVADVFDLRRLGREDLLLARRDLGSWVDFAAESWAQGPERFIFTSSGSQGDPKRVVHSAAQLWAEARVLADHLPGRRRIVSLVPAHHIYGFIFTVLLPRALSVPVLDLSAEGAGALRRHLAPRDLVVAVPAVWRYLHRALADVPKGVAGTSSAAPLDAETACGLVNETGFARIVEVYGSSETAGIGLRDDPNHPFELLATWATAEAWDGQPENDAPGTLVRSSDGARVQPPDRLVWEGPRHLCPTGRLDGAVTVAGVTVHPDAIARKLARCPGVQDARVRPSGNRLKALLVPERGTDALALRRDVRRWAETTLQPAERPITYTVSDTVPRDALGKETDWPLDTH
ncbi:AMP-binding protein [Rhodovibrio salinarum]|uniref:AMP-binding protein n=1 Tax=Rhodovibrio salinarum TaxID=1087 RepID=UPI0004ADCF76|nr:AMP-binding protein [Rhodovibrio salinarum]